MKLVIASFCLLLVLTACVENNASQVTLEDFKENNYNFNLDQKVKYKNISFELPTSFKKNFSTRITITNHGNTFVQSNLGIYFTVERFLPKDKSRAFVQDFVIEQDLLNTFQDAYAAKRFSTLENAGLSIKKDLFNSPKKVGVIQTLQGESSAFYGEEMIYGLATVQINQEYYVFQFITGKSLMNYSMDDFKRILHSVKPLK